MTDAFRCPSCRGPLASASDAFLCETCGETFPVVGGIPTFASATDQDKQRQARYFNAEVDEEFEITRPQGTPRLYGWLLAEKFRRSIKGLDLEGSSALAVCAGSGMDAEFLARAGARVVTADISDGAARRTCERARRTCVNLVSIVADVERLPFDDKAFDVVYVHDGLHHLQRPLAALEEMSRVARHAVCVAEPARAALTAVAVKLGLADEREEAGNRVERLSLLEVEDVLRDHGFRIIGSARYGMFYRHEPGAAIRLLSLPLVYPVTVAAFRSANRILGRLGNKLAVVGVRG